MGADDFLELGEPAGSEDFLLLFWETCEDVDSDDLLELVCSEDLLKMICMCSLVSGSGVNITSVPVVVNVLHSSLLSLLHLMRSHDCVASEVANASHSLLFCRIWCASPLKQLGNSFSRFRQVFHTSWERNSGRLIFCCLLEVACLRWWPLELFLACIGLRLPTL